jgi:hypothetical protein
VDERITIDGGKNSPGSGSKAGDSEEVRGSSMKARKSNLDALNGGRAGFCDGLYRRGKKGRERGGEATHSRNTTHQKVDCWQSKVSLAGLD